MNTFLNINIFNLSKIIRLKMIYRKFTRRIEQKTHLTLMQKFFKH